MVYFASFLRLISTVSSHDSGCVIHAPAGIPSRIQLAHALLQAEIIILPPPSGPKLRFPTLGPEQPSPPLQNSRARPCSQRICSSYFCIEPGSRRPSVIHRYYAPGREVQQTLHFVYSCIVSQMCRLHTVKESVLCVTHVPFPLGTLLCPLCV